MSEPYFHEFMWRGRRPGDPTPPAFHIGLSADVPDPFGGPPQPADRILNMRQAEEAGWGLPEAIAAINAEALREVEALREQVEQLTAERDEARTRADALAQLRARDAAVVAEVREQAQALLKAPAPKGGRKAKG